MSRGAEQMEEEGARLRGQSNSGAELGAPCTCKQCGETKP